MKGKEMKERRMTTRLKMKEKRMITRLKMKRRLHILIIIIQEEDVLIMWLSMVE